MTTISRADKLKCVQRELAMRRNVYPKWIASGRMTVQNAAREIATMEAVVNDYLQPVDKGDERA